MTRAALTVTDLQEQIFQREGFRVSFERLGADRDVSLPPYDFPVMAPTGWRVSDWKRARLAHYLTHFRSVTVYRGDGTPLARDVKLGHLRDTYYEAEHGTIAPPEGSIVAAETEAAPKRAPAKRSDRTPPRRRSAPHR